MPYAPQKSSKEIWDSFLFFMIVRYFLTRYFIARLKKSMFSAAK